MGGFVGWLDRRQRRHPVLGLPLAVIYKFFDDQGFYLGALIAFYGFISLFPLFLLFSTILGFALDSDPGLREQLLDSAARQIPVIGSQIEARELRGSGTAVTIAAVTATFGSLGVAQAVQNAMNATWGVRRNERPNPVTSRLRSLGLLAMLGLFVIATTLLSQLEAVLGSRLTWLPGSSAGILPLGSFVLSAVFFVFLCRLGTAQQPEVRQLVPGAILAALAWQGLQAGGNTFVTTVVARASTTNGVFAVVMGLMAWLYLAGVALVLCLETNAVWAQQLYPRALLTPMTDRVDLTDADRVAYARLVRAQSLKGFQNVDVTFDHDGQNATARRRKREELAAASAADTGGGLREIVRRGATALPRRSGAGGRSPRAEGQAEPAGHPAPR